MPAPTAVDPLEPASSLGVLPISWSEKLLDMPLSPLTPDPVLTPDPSRPNGMMPLSADIGSGVAETGRPSVLFCAVAALPDELVESESSDPFEGPPPWLVVDDEPEKGALLLPPPVCWMSFEMVIRPVSILQSTSQVEVRSSNRGFVTPAMYPGLRVFDVVSLVHRHMIQK